MTARKENSWMPSSQNEYTLLLGGTFRRSFKAGKGQPLPPPPKVSRDFYSFRCKGPPSFCRLVTLYDATEDSYKPESSSSSWTGTMEVKRGQGDDQVTVEHPSIAAPGETHIFNGSIKAAKDKECILIYDETTGTVTLEKLDSNITATYSHKAFASDPGTPLDTPNLSPSVRIDEDAADELEKEVLAMNGARDDEDRSAKVLAGLPGTILPKEEEEEPSEGEIVPSPVGPRPSQRPPIIPAPRPLSMGRKHVMKSPSKAASKAAPPPTKILTAPAPVPKPKTKKRERELAPSPMVTKPKIAADEEHFELSLPSRAPKRPRPSPPPTSRTAPGLSLPSGPALSLPGPPALSLPGSSSESSFLSLPSHPPEPGVATAMDTILAGGDSEDEDGDLWEDAIQLAPVKEASPPHIEIEEDFGVEEYTPSLPHAMDEEEDEDEEDEFDESAFAEAMDEQFRVDDVDDEDDLFNSPVVDQRGPPMTTDPYAAQQQVSEDDDDSDSDDDSDDD